MEEISESEISRYITHGVYHAKPGRTGGGKYYRVLNDIYDNNNQRVKCIYQCTKCKQVIKCNPSNGTKPLNSHAAKCDPQEKGISRISRLLMLL